MVVVVVDHRWDQRECSCIGMQELVVVVVVVVVVVAFERCPFVQQSFWGPKRKKKNKKNENPF